MSPPALDRVVKKCLAKDPEERWQDAADLGSELKWIAEGASQAGLPAPVAARQRVGPRLAGAVAGVVLGALAAGLGVWWLSREPAHETPKPAWLSMLLPSDAPLASYGAQTVAFAPDGTCLVYAAEHGGTTQLYLRALDRLEAMPVRDSEGALSAFFSPDSRWLGFFTGTRLMKVPVEGGMPQPICEAGRRGRQSSSERSWFTGHRLRSAFSLWRLSVRGVPRDANPRASSADAGEDLVATHTDPPVGETRMQTREQAAQARKMHLNHSIAEVAGLCF